MGSTAEQWWMLGVAVGGLGVLAFIAGFVSGGPDVVGGVVFGGVALAAAGVMLWRRAPRVRGPGPERSLPGPSDRTNS